MLRSFLLHNTKNCPERPSPIVPGSFSRRNLLPWMSNQMSRSNVLIQECSNFFCCDGLILTLNRDGDGCALLWRIQKAFCNAKWSLYIRRHCLLRMRTPFELQNDFSVAILGLSKFFSEGCRCDCTDKCKSRTGLAVFTAKPMQNTCCSK